MDINVNVPTIICVDYKLINYHFNDRTPTGKRLVCRMHINRAVPNIDEIRYRIGCSKRHFNYSKMTDYYRHFNIFRIRFMAADVPEVVPKVSTLQRPAATINISQIQPSPFDDPVHNGVKYSSPISEII